jgi:hypothetical protein
MVVTMVAQGFVSRQLIGLLRMSDVRELGLPLVQQLLLRSFLELGHPAKEAR